MAVVECCVFAYSYRASSGSYTSGDQEAIPRRRGRGRSSLRGELRTVRKSKTRGTPSVYGGSQEAGKGGVGA